jgi:phage gp29-like protein
MKMLDLFKFAAPKKAATKPEAGLLASEIATYNLVNFLTTIPDPDAVLAKAGIRRHQLAVLESDDEIFGALETRRDACIATPWHLEPQEGTTSKFVEEVLTPHIEPLMRAAWKAVPYGYSVSEIVWKQDGSRIVIDRAGEKPIEWFEPQRDGTLRYKPPEGDFGDPAGKLVDTTYKFVLTRRNPTYMNPYGDALLSRLYWAFFFRHNGLRFWAQFLERFGNPVILGKTASPKSFIEAVQKLGIDAAIAVGVAEDVTAVTQSGSGEFDLFERAMARRVQKIVLGQTLTTDVDGKGSYAAAQVHNMVRMDKRASDLALVSASIQRVVDAIVALNFPGAESPVFTMADERGLEVERAKRDCELTKNRVLKFTKEYLLDRYDFEEGDFEVPETQMPIGQNGAQGAQENGQGEVPGNAGGGFSLVPGRSTGVFRDGVRFTPEQDVVERLGDGLLAADVQPIDPRLVRSAVIQATSPEDLADRLAALLPGVTGSRFAALLERALFAADILGFIHAAEQAGDTRSDGTPPAQD